MSPKSRGRPPGRGRKKQRRRSLSAPGRGAEGAPGAPRPSHLRLVATDEGSAEHVETDCWFGEPDPGDRRSWAMPPGHGTYDEIDLERLDPEDEDDLRLLLEARHPEYADALRDHEEMVIDGEKFSPTAHVSMHHVVARQLLTDNPPETWQTVQRLAGLGYDWHNIMHMIAGLVAEDVHRVMTQGARFDAADYARRLGRLPGDWPPPGSE